MNKKVFLNNIIIAVIASLIIRFIPLIVTEYLVQALVTVGVGIIIGMLIPLFHRLIKPRSFLAWCILNILIVGIAVSLINIHVILQKGGFISMLSYYLTIVFVTISGTWLFYKKYKIGNQKLKKKQNEFIN